MGTYQNKPYYRKDKLTGKFVKVVPEPVVFGQEDERKYFKIKTNQFRREGKR